MNNVFKGKTVLVTGGTGSIGCEIVKQVLTEGATNVVSFSRDEIKSFQIKNNMPDLRLKSIIGDIRDLASLEKEFDRFGFDIIFHCAAMKHLPICEEFPCEAAKTNILGTENVINLALKYHVTKMITISTDKAVNPTNVMGATKQIAERITLNANRVSLNNGVFSCVRFGNVANSRGSVIPVFIERLLRGKPLQVSNPEITRFIINIKEATRFVIDASSVALGGEIFVLKMKAFKLGDLVDVIKSRIIQKLNIPDSQFRVETVGIIEGEKLHEQLISDPELSRMYNWDNMYVVLPNNDVFSNYTGLSKVALSSYKSNDVKLLSKVEIERLVMEYLEERCILL
jgi:FlaA1/EpsC-like NDP-sugar epimerase